VFTAGGVRRDRFAPRLEGELAQSFGLRTDAFARSADEWREVIARNPFPREAERDPGHTTVLLLEGATTDRAWKALEGANTGPEIIRGEDEHGYVVYPDGIGRSRLTHGRIERTLGTQAPTRNWNTVVNLGSLLPP
jgi:uncharacterized protein (DUF1697 family)